MSSIYDYDAVVIGSGPNGLAAAITLAQAGCSVCVYEALGTIGGGMRTAELTLPDFKHDICSAIHPLGAGSPFFRTLPLEEHGLRWIQPELSLAHPFDNGKVAVLARSIEQTAKSLGVDAQRYQQLITPLVNHWDNIAEEILRPLRIPHHPIALGRFGIFAGLPTTLLSKLWFKDETAQGFFAGLSAHSFLKMEQLISSSFGLVLGILGHTVGWVIPEGGSQSIADALGSYFKSLGGEIVVNHPIHTMDELPYARAYFFNTSPHHLGRIAEDRLPTNYVRRLNKFRHGPGIFKVDWALDAPIPWRSPECAKAGTVHLGSTLDEISISERAIWRGQHVEKPYVLVAQQSLFDTTRAPEGKHTAWAYCHVPSGSTVDMTEAIENQIERFAPNFKSHILKRHTMNSANFEGYNPNYHGGDINGGVQDLFQLFARPILRLNPYSTPAKNIYLCSASTPPGGGVHGMAGYHAAKRALKRL